MARHNTMNKHYLQILFLLVILTGCKKEQEAPDGLHSISQISWTTYDKDNSGLQDNFILNVEIDKNDNIWIGTFSEGIAKFDGINWIVYNTHNSGLSNDSICDMCFDNQNNLWIGTSNGLTKFDGTNWTVYNMENSNLPVRFVFSVAVDKDNILWIGCGNSEKGGLMKFDGTNWELFTPENSILPSRIISKIFVDRSNNKWLATWPYQDKGGVVKIEGHKWTVFNKYNSIIPYNMADDITQDKNGNIWVAITALLYDKYGVFEGSLLRYDGKNWKEFKPHDYVPKLTNRISCVKVDMNNNIWIATEPESNEPQKYEIAMFNGKEWYVVSEIDSTFPHDYIDDMEFDKNNNLWIGLIDFGLSKLISK